MTTTRKSPRDAGNSRGLGFLSGGTNYGHFNAISKVSIRRNALVDNRSDITMNDSQRNITTSTWPVSIPVAISSRHVHLTQAMIERLFGDKYRLHVDSALHQPHQYLAMETVTLVGP